MSPEAIRAGLKVKCPGCGSSAGRPCVNIISGRRIEDRVHQLRRRAAEQLDKPKKL
ncbi:hypothetical protein Asi03nite_46530 [Actinoplanes siamensis]|uniref:DNA-binding phage zinc finger domain-containing protein n=1 Tax=Actinoplanes siamensis TaxID=1223317 RepID=A0A919NAA0_9ACTN|nr:hypothetical protein Asi03nite_46530 [Actinoplanes siamensis]